MSNAETMTIAVPETKKCTQCKRRQPLSEFRFQNREQGIRHAECNECFKAYFRARTEKHRKLDLKQRIDQLATDPGNPASYGVATRSEAVIKGMLTRFGGLERFADEWFQFLRLAHLAGKHHIVQRSFEAMLRLMSLVDSTQNDRGKSLDAMNDAELKQFITEAFIERLWGNPEIAVAVLERMGWTLTPPDAATQQAFEGSVVGDVQQRLIRLLRIPTSQPHPATELLMDDEDDDRDDMDSDDDEQLFDDAEFALFAAQETGESGGSLT